MGGWKRKYKLARVFLLPHARVFLRIFDFAENRVHPEKQQNIQLGVYTLGWTSLLNEGLSLVFDCRVPSDNQLHQSVQLFGESSLERRPNTPREIWIARVNFHMKVCHPEIQSEEEVAQWTLRNTPRGLYYPRQELSEKCYLRGEAESPRLFTCGKSLLRDQIPGRQAREPR